MKVGILDYDMGNLKSVYNSLDRINIKSDVVTTYKNIKKIDILILPGVGAFKEGMKNLKKKNFIYEIKNHFLKEKKILGICLGMQLLCKQSEEHGNTKGLGIFDTNVVRLKPKNKKTKLPHIGFNDVNINSKGKLFHDFKKNPVFYFNHMYGIKSLNDESSVLSFTNYDEKIISIIEKNNVCGAQFHPEKSQMNGLKFLKNFINW